jgi:hypothetical protein
VKALGGGVSQATDHEPVATIVRTVPVRVVEVSRGGCKLESEARLEPGLSGQLALQLQGMARVDDIRVTRCQQRVGGTALFQVGAELLKTKHLGKRSVRLAVSKIISEQVEGVGRGQGKTTAPRALQPRTTALGKCAVGRAPPSHPDRGS